MKNKLLAILLSFAVAVGIWLYVITVVNPESEKTYYEIPVILQNKDILAERGLMVVSDEPKVTLVLKSDRTILNELNEANINVITNVANIEKTGTHNLTYTIAYPGNIPDNEVFVQSSSTDLITLKVENRIRKSVPVIIDYGETALPEGYIANLENAQLDHTSIEVVGPESVMSQISQAVIDVDLNNQTQTIIGEYQYILCDEQGAPVNAEKVTVNAEKVNLILTIQRQKELALKVEVIYGGGATEKTSTVTIDPTQIQISGSDASLEGLDTLVVGTINLAEILEDKTFTFPITLPEGVTNQTGVNVVTVTIKFAEMITKTFNIKAISAANVPEGLQAEIITKALSVTVRGTANMIKAIKETDISVQVDLSESQLGTATMAAEVIVSDAFPGVGAVGTYPVSVKVREK